MVTTSGRADRQRRERQVARQRILEAASGLLEEHRWTDVRLEDVMSAAGLSRTAFYRHFDDRHTLLLAMLDEIRQHIGSTGAAWKAGDPHPVSALCTGLAELTTSMQEHGRLMQAVADAAAYDAGIRAARAEMVGFFVAVTADRIRADVAAGHSRVRDPERVADALVRMNEALLLDAFGSRPYADPAEVRATISEIWVTTIYGREALDTYRASGDGSRGQRST
jgi:TetR/AcrR family transcriptional regulator, ethionamide resistance regulator